MTSPRDSEGEPAEGLDPSGTAAVAGGRAPSDRVPTPDPRPSSDRLPDDPVWRQVALAAHDAAVAAGEDGYLDPVTGLFVMTAGYLSARGTCCGSNCRHCPYGTRP